MNFRPNKMLAAAMLIASILPCTAFATQNAAQDVAAIQDIVEKFRTSIIDRDKTTFSSLFFSENPEEVI